MKNELTKQFVKKMIKRVFIFTILVIVFTSITRAMTPVVTNELALTQMQNSNEMFVLMQTYSNLRPVVNLIYGAILVLFAYGIGRDTYKFIKSIEETTEN